MPFNLFTSALRSANPFWNASVMNSGGVRKFRQFGPEIGCLERLVRGQIVYL